MSLADEKVRDRPSEEENAHHAPVESRPRRGGGVRRCFRRFWWLILGFLIAAILIVVLCVIYVAIPHMAQSDVDASTLTITSLKVTNPTANSIHMVQDAILSSNSSFHPWIDSFNASIGLTGASAYAVITLPGIISGTSVPAHVDQTVTITDMDAFKDYNAALMNSSEITQFLSGGTWLHEGSLPADWVNYNKEVKLAGYNSLKGFNLTDFKVLSSPEDDGSNALGTVFIPNPTVLTVDMGNVTFDNYVPNDPKAADPSANMTLIGNSTLNNFVFKPGDNSVPMRSVVNQLAVIGLIGPGGPYPDGVLPITIVGRSSVYNGVELPYYEAALKAANQTIHLNVTAALSS